MLATRRYDPPPPPLVPLEPPADYTSLTVPEPMAGPEARERAAGFGSTPARLPSGLQGDGVLMNAAAGLAQGVYGTLGLPVDAMTGALNGGIYLANLAGADLPRIEDPFLGSRSLARGGAYLGIPDPQDVAAVTPAERIARGVGEGASYAVAPAAVVRGGAALAGRELPSLAQAVFGRINSVREAGRDMAIGATAGATGKMARELVPEAWQPTAEVVGGLLGGVAAAGAETAFRAVGQTLRRVASANVSPAWDRQYSYPDLDGTKSVHHQSRGDSKLQGKKSGEDPRAAPTFEDARERKIRQLAINKSVGSAYERDALTSISPDESIYLQPQVTVRSGGPLGLAVRLDAVGTHLGTGAPMFFEFKSSRTAPLTRRQKDGFPELEGFGGPYVSYGKPPHTRGMSFPPTSVKVIRDITK